MKGYGGILCHTVKERTAKRFISERMCNLERNENGKPMRIQGIFRDITKR